VSALARREAAAIREEWLGLALSTLPADRPAAEAALSGLYELIGLRPPRFHWVSSPLMAVETIPPGVRPLSSTTQDNETTWPLLSRFAALARRLSFELDSHVVRVHLLMGRMIRQEVLSPLARSAAASLVPMYREATGRNRPILYETQSVAWIAQYDALRRVVGVNFTPEQARELDLWTAALRSCHLWWPREDVCVISERPVAVHTEVTGDRGEVRPHRADGPAVRYADGWEVYAWHGTLVPSWVVTDPTPERIARERNVEVRRCAIENIGWPGYIERGRLRLVASAPDPGNPGTELRLYDLRRNTRVLLAVNGSVERDGHRRQYGLTVPGAIGDPVAAAGWTYGLSAEQYSLLLRRT
jgi:hypothetical protein